MRVELHQLRTEVQKKVSELGELVREEVKKLSGHASTLQKQCADVGDAIAEHARKLGAVDSALSDASKNLSGLGERVAALEEQRAFVVKLEGRVSALEAAMKSRNLGDN